MIKEPFWKGGERVIRQLIRWLITIAFGIIGTTLFIFLNKMQGFVTMQNQLIIIAMSIFIACGIFGLASSKFITNAIVATTDHTLSTLTMHSAKELLLETLGVIIGLIVANLISFSFVFTLPIYGIIINIFMNIILGYLGFKIAAMKKDEIPVFNFQPKEKKKSKVYGQAKVLDTSSIIDGRIMDLLKTGFLEGKIIVPSFVLEELRHIADSSDPLRRNRGRRGLDILNAMQKQMNVPIEIVEKDYPGVTEVDSKLVKLAQELEASVITNDFNLNKVADFQGVCALNINELANAIKPVLLPGEEMQVSVIKDGKEVHQGIGYLDDGTMIVVEGGRKYIGETICVTVTSVLQTAAGRMIFTKTKDAEKAS